jgi:hypothetical protein
MKNPKIKTEVKHSESKTAWNIIGKSLGGKYKIARVPYTIINQKEYEIINTKSKNEALEHALYISQCFNNSDTICDCLYHV